MHKLFLGFSTLIIAMIALTACGGSSSTPQGIAPAKPGTLLRSIQDRGKLVVGVKFDVPTFGSLNTKTNQMEGFEPAIAREIAAYIFGDANKVEFKESVTATRQEELKKGTFDLIISTVTITEDRAKDIDFSVPYYQTGLRLLVPTASSIKTVTDLNGKKVGLAKGSAYTTWLKTNTKGTVVEFDTQAIAAQEMIKGVIDAVAANDAILYGVQLATPGTKVVGAPATSEYFGVGVAKNNPELLDAVNTVIKNLKSSGKWKTMWQTEVGTKIGVTLAPEPPGDDWKK